MSVLIHQDGLSFFIDNGNEIVNTITRDFKHQSNPIEILESIEQAYEQEDKLQQKFDEVNLIYHHSILSLVPASLYEESLQADYLKYNTRILQTDVISIDENVGNMNVNVVYIAYSNINNFFFDKYGDHQYYHYSSRLLPIIKEVDGLHIEMMDSHFYLTAIQQGKLIAHNSFPYDEIEDVLYYTLYAMSQHQLDPETIDTYLRGGNVDPKLFDLLYMYIRKLHRDKEYTIHLNKLICA
ncbi:DUF3822 family protein [Nonlabens ponticola]|uniref:DUF3822 family protein n=1 Tax=Nonlabens ponticola TaxID=2496866 RepID=UPI0013DF14B3|nr:DUF3822 family protein [Nonlabens ponticola]